MPSSAKSRKQKKFATDYRNIAASKQSEDSSSEDAYLDTSDDESIEVSNRETTEEDLKDPEVIEEVTLLGEEENYDEGSDLDNLAEELTRLEIMVEKFGIDFVMPFIQYYYIEENRRHVTVVFLVLTLNKDKFPPRVLTDRKELHVGTTVPSFFQNKVRIMLTNKCKDAEFTSNTHKATAFAEVVRGMMTELEWPDDLNDSVQQTKLPFHCEEDIVSWEVQAFENEDDDLTTSLGQQYVLCLHWS